MLTNMSETNERPKVGRPKRPPRPKTDIVRRVRYALADDNGGDAPTQEQFAAMMKCSWTAIAKMEQEQRLPGPFLLERFTELAQKAGIALDGAPEPGA